MIIRAQRQKDWDHKVKLGSFERVYDGVNLGELKGNRFSVALRFINESIEDSAIL
jgi:tRNA(Glu) U13 pseudouridine synthase TruD